MNNKNGCFLLYSLQKYFHTFATPNFQPNGNGFRQISGLKDMTYDDVLLLPAYSEVLPRDVDVNEPCCRKTSASISRLFLLQWIRLRIPQWRNCHGPGRWDRGVAPEHDH